MTIDVSYRYGKFSKGIVFFLMTFWCAGLGVFVTFFAKKLIKIPSSGNAIFSLMPFILGILFFVFALIFFGFGVYRVKGSKKKNKILAKGKKGIGAIGNLSSKTVYYQGRIDTKKLVFYYKLNDGRYGETTQLISSSLYHKLKSRNRRDIPIKVLGDRAVIDEGEF